MLVNLTLINSFETEMEIHTKNLNRYFSGFTIKKKKEWKYDLNKTKILDYFNISKEL